MTIYYVANAPAGSDANNGTSELTPWETLDKADDGPYNAGDTVKLKKGDQWRETYGVPSDGSEGSPITLTSYGSGADPIINGADLIVTWTEYGDWTQDLHDDFEDGTLDYWTVQGDCIVDEESKYADTYGMHIDFPGTTGRVYKTCTSKNHVKCDFYWQLKAETFENGEKCAVVRSESSGAGQMWVWVGQDSGNLYLSLAQGEDFSADNDFQIVIEQWYHIVVEMDQSGKMTLTVDDDLKATEAATSSGNIDKWYFGNYSGNQDSDADTYFDDVSTYYHAAQANTWQAACTTEPDIVWLDETRGTKEGSIANLTAENEWFWVGDVLYVYSTGDPDDDYTSPGTEAIAENQCIWCGKDYIIFDGLECKYAKAGIKGSGVSNIQINNCSLHDMFAQGIYIYNTSDNFTVDSCSVYLCGITEFDGAVNIVDTITGTISNCTIYDNVTTVDGWGIGLINSSSVTVRQNTLYGNGESGVNGSAIEMYNADSCLIYRNNCYGSFVMIEMGEGSDGNEIYYNIFRDSTGDNLMSLSTEGDDCINNEIYNNVFAAPNTNKYCMTFFAGTGCIVKNNIFYGVTGTGYAVYYDAPSYATFNNNCYTANGSGDIVNDVQGNGARTLAEWRVDSGQDANSMVDDPLFVDAGSDDYTLQPTSPCINAGVDVGLDRDFAGNPVPQGSAPDIGANEYIYAEDAQRRRRIDGKLLIYQY